jgi:hypothetical protein
MTPTCPKDAAHSIRIEYSHELGRTLFCAECMQHHKLCNSTQFMEPCELPPNHPPSHKGHHGEWT